MADPESQDAELPLPEDVAATGRHFPIVAIGASAGGLEAFEGFFAKMPVDSGLAFILIQHLDPTHKSMLPELVARFTEMPVCEIADGMTVVPNHVYVIPPDRDLGILRGTLHLFEPAERRGLRHPIDFFFHSLGLDRGKDAVAMVFSGTGSEGAQGVRDIKGAGGVVLVQEPETAKFDSMPRAAVATGVADLVVPVAKMVEPLLALAQGHRPKRLLRPPDSDADPTDYLNKIILLLRTQTGHDLSLYKPNTLARRIKQRMLVHRLEHIGDYVRFLQETSREASALFNEVLIGVTRFFRDPDTFAALKDVVIPALTDQRRPDDEVRVWVPGCSTGEEAVSIALLLHERLAELGQETRVRIFASDIDRRAIAKARAGLYPEAIAKDVPPDLLRRYFSTEGSAYRVSKTIRDSIVFAEHSLFRDPPFSRLDLISCRNLLIYIGSPLQKKAVLLFHYALRPEGYLFLGTSESIGDVPDLFSIVDRKMKIYQRKGGAPLRLPSLTFGPTPPTRSAPSEDIVMEKPESLLALSGEIEKMILTEVTPPCVIINRKFDILFFHGSTGKYLEPAPGTAALNVLAMAREGLKAALAVALNSVFDQPGDVVCPRLRVGSEGDQRLVTLRVRPLTSLPSLRGLALIMFDELAADPVEPVGESGGEAQLGAPQRIRDLERELQASKEYLRTTIEELEAANEELKSTNEELQSSMEELQSINEEHETAREELQSVNEELVTTNCQLESKVEELAAANDDMANLLASTDIGTIFLDRKLHIKRFTPAVTHVYNLIQTDIGRPLSDIAANLSYSRLISDAVLVLNTLVPRVSEGSTREGRWYRVRILPYRTTEGVIDGVVITFIDITDQKLLESRSRLATVVRDSNDAVTVVDFAGRILAWNRGAEHVYGFAECEAVGETIDTVFGEPRQREIRDLLRRVAAGDRIEPFETNRQTRDGRTIPVQVTATILRDDQERPQAVATTERDLSETLTGRQQRQEVALLQALPLPVVIEDGDGVLIDLNHAAEVLFGTSRDQAIGQPAASLLPPDDLAESERQLALCRQGQTIRCAGGRRRLSDGSVRAVPLILISLPAGSVATIVEALP